mmetsp:Transcript_35315/g.103481  ORF Transcript_35315/g.103481 Transcript_35315/m.103481 type:complete len:154 (-) Transcript_35315:199-660(-)
MDMEDADGGGSLQAAASSSSTDERSPSAAASAAGHVPSPLSMQVREMRRGGDAQRGIKQNMLLAFDNVMPRLDTVYAAMVAEAPLDFENKIHFWHSKCAMRADLKNRLHTLRIWANAARHYDDERWRRDGPHDEAEASRLVSSVQAAIEALER